MGHWWQKKHCLVMGQEGQHCPPIFQQPQAGFYTRPTAAAAAFKSSGKNRNVSNEAPRRARAPVELLSCACAPCFAQVCRQDGVGTSLQLQIQTLLQAWLTAAHHAQMPQTRAARQLPHHACMLCHTLFSHAQQVSWLTSTSGPSLCRERGQIYLPNSCTDQSSSPALPWKGCHICL